MKTHKTSSYDRLYKIDLSSFQYPNEAIPNRNSNISSLLSSTKMFCDLTDSRADNFRFKLQGH